MSFVLSRPRARARCPRMPDKSNLIEVMATPSLIRLEAGQACGEKAQAGGRMTAP